MLIPFLSLANVDHDYFHPAASAFIHGDTTTASNRVELGLQRYPNEPKLMQLKKLIEQQEQQEQQIQLNLIKGQVLLIFTTWDLREHK